MHHHRQFILDTENIVFIIRLMDMEQMVKKADG